MADGSMDELLTMDGWMDDTKAFYTAISCLKTLSRKELNSDFK